MKILGKSELSELGKPAEYRFYRFTFIPRDAYFQLSEITLTGLELPKSSPVPADYRRDLNVMRGVSTTRFSMDGTEFQREMIVSKPAEVIAMRIRASKMGSLNFTAGLSRARNAKVHADGIAHVMQGQLPFSKPGTSLRNEGYENQVRTRLQSALTIPFEKLLTDATRDHASYMDRCKIELPAALSVHARSGISPEILPAVAQCVGVLCRRAC